MVSAVVETRRIPWILELEVAMNHDAETEARRLRMVLSQGLALTLVQAVARTFEMGATAAELSPGGLALALLPAIGLVLLGESLLLLLGRVPRTQKWWPRIVTVLHVASALAVVCESRYFMVTGTRFDMELLIYSIRNASSLHGVAGVGLDSMLIWTSLWALLLMALAVRLSRSENTKPARIRTSIEVTFVVLGLVVFTGAAPSPKKLNRHALGSVLGEEWTELQIRPQTEHDNPRITGVGSERLPNFLVVILESTRATALGAYRDPGASSDSPFMDEFASKGVVVEFAYSTVTHTSKAIVGILCGAFPRLQTEIGEAEENGIPMDCLPKVLRQAGYRTKFIQSATGEFEHRASLLENLGFESWKTREDLDSQRFEHVGYFGMDERSLIEPSLDWIGENEEPFLLTLLTSATHHPYQLPGEPAPQLVIEEEGHYRRAVRHTDEALGELISEVLERRPDTIVVLVGDHGEGFGEHVERGHNLVPYEEGVRIPLIIGGPVSRVGEPRRVKGLRHQIDVLPTLLNLSSARWTGTLMGRDLFGDEGHGVVMSSCWQSRRCLSMRVSNMKFIYRYGIRETEVYDLTSDPTESKNVAAVYPKTLIDGVETLMLETRANIDRYYFLTDRRRSR